MIRVYASLFLFIFFSLNALANKEWIECRLLINSKVIQKSSIQTPISSKKLWAEYQGLKFYISGPNSLNHFLLEIFRPQIPSREYLEAGLKDIGSSFAYASWSRDSLLEIKCLRKQ